MFVFIATMFAYLTCCILEGCCIFQQICCIFFINNLILCGTTMETCLFCGVALCKVYFRISSKLTPSRQSRIFCKIGSIFCKKLQQTKTTNWLYFFVEERTLEMKKQQQMCLELLDVIKETAHYIFISAFRNWKVVTITKCQLECLG